MIEKYGVNDKEYKYDTEWRSDDEADDAGMYEVQDHCAEIDKADEQDRRFDLSFEGVDVLRLTELGVLYDLGSSVLGKSVICSSSEYEFQRIR